MGKNELGGVIAKKLILRILLFSSLITLIFTSWQLFSDYQIGRNHIIETLDEIEDSHIQSISRSVWTSDRRQLEAQLKGILRLHGIRYVKVSYDNDFLEAGVSQQENIISRQIPLTYNFNNKENNLGTLYLVASLQDLYSRLINRIFFIFVTQGVKTFLVSAFIFFIFQNLVTSRLSVIGQYAKNLAIENLGAPLNIQRKNIEKNRPDELEIVASALNSMRLNLQAQIEEHEKDKEKIKSSLKEKQILLEEIHHRVKNNMNVVSSLLDLQARHIEDDRTKDILKESQNRIFAMSAIHETIHGSENLSEISLKKYLSSIADSVFQSFSISSEKVKLIKDIEDLPISINLASPVGLVINELMSNSQKYAFPQDREGEIKVSMKKQDKELELVVMDNGIGMSDKLDWKNSSTLGLKLVRTLVEDQLAGSIKLESKKGTKFTIKFNIES